MNTDAYEADLMTGVYDLMEKVGRKYGPLDLGPGMMTADPDTVTKVMLSAIAAVAAHTPECATDAGCRRFADRIAGFLAESVANVRDTHLAAMTYRNLQ